MSMDRRESAEISGLLSIGFLADRMLLALDLHPTNEIQQREPGLLSQLSGFLDAIVQLAERPAAILSREPVAFAIPPAEYAVLDLLPVELDEAQLTGVVSTVRRMRRTVATIQEGNAPEAPDLDDLKTLLERLADSSLEEVDSRRMRSEAGALDRRRLLEWQKTLTH